MYVSYLGSLSHLHQTHVVELLSGSTRFLEKLILTHVAASVTHRPKSVLTAIYRFADPNLPFSNSALSFKAFRTQRGIVS